MEDFGNIKKTNDIAFLVANRLTTVALISQICKGVNNIPNAGNDAGP